MRQFADNPCYAVSEELLLELARLQAEGMADAPILDPIYEEMEQVEALLNRSETDRLNGLSADLYMLEGRDIRQPLEDGMTTEERDRLLGEASEQQDCERLLQLLRKGEASFPPPVLAFIRGSAYGGLGHSEAALVFLRQACKLDPNNEEYQSVLIDQLVLRDDLSEAVAEANSIVQDPGASPALRLQAGTILFLSARRLAATDQVSVVDHAASVIKQALDDASTAGQRDVFVAAGWVTLGGCYTMLQRVNDARHAYDTAMEIVPDYAEALVERGFLRMATDMAGAISDFQAAIQAGTYFLAPYLHVAYDALVKEDFDRCRALCQRILRRRPSNPVCAVVYHWLAECEYRQDRPLQARSYLQKALSLEPFNDGIRADLEMMGSSATAGSSADAPLYHIKPVTTLPEARSDPMQRQALPLAA